MELIEVNFNDEGDIIDTLSGKILKDTPEERVRQRFINILQSDYGYPKNIIAREVPVQQGSKILSSDDGAEIRADIVVYTSKKACLERDQGNILFVVECKSQTQQKAIHSWCLTFSILLRLAVYGRTEMELAYIRKKLAEKWGWMKF